MFRTIKLKLPYDRSLLETGRQFREACQMVLDYGFAEKTYNKNKLNMLTIICMIIILLMRQLN